MTVEISEHAATDTTAHQELQRITTQVLDEAVRQGATATEVGCSLETGYNVNVRMGEVEVLEYNRDKGVAITVYFDHCTGSASTSDTSAAAVSAAVTAACNIARYTSTDPYAGLADKERLAFGYDALDLDLCHPWQLTPAAAIEQAQACEQYGFAFDPRIKNSDGCSLSTHSAYRVYANSHGFVGAYPTTRHSISCVLVAEDGSGMQRDYAYSSARTADDLFSLQYIGEEAAARAVKRLQAKRVPTCKVPVIFAADVARGLLGSFFSAISGGAIYRRASFLLDSVGEVIFPAHINFTENPHLPRGSGSAPFDGDGVKTVQRDWVKDGVVQSYVLSSYSARKLGLQTTGNAGGVRNIKVNTSDKDLNQLIKDMGEGLLIAELMGQGVNMVTGDYSRGASGFWVSQGQVQYPVEEITIAGNLKQMFANIVTIGNDVDTRGNIHTGSILLDGMTIAGE